MGLGGCGADPQRRVVLQEALADRVDGADHLGAGAEVAAERQHLTAGARRDRLASLAEDVEVGVAEAIDRLQFVADDHQLRLRPAQRFDQAQLQAVGVLELVDEQVAEAGAVCRPGFFFQQPHRQQLQVLEVDPGAPLLGGAEAGGEKPQQLADVGEGDPTFAGLGDATDGGVDRLPVGRHRFRLAPRPQLCDRVEVRRLCRCLEQRQRSLDQLVVGAARFELLGGLRGNRGGVAQCPFGIGRWWLGQPRLGLAAAA